MASSAGWVHNITIVELTLTTSNLGVGVDVGGSSIKCALIDLATGSFVSERFSTPTPAQDSTDMLLTGLAQVVGKVPGGEFEQGLDRATLGPARRRRPEPAGGCHQRCRRGRPRRTQVRRRAGG